ncbi:MAG: hypothetical protein ACE3JP_07720 [Ectobacillus sp.]
MTIRKYKPSVLIVISELYNPFELDDSVASYANMFLDGWNKIVHAAGDKHKPVIVLPVRKLIPNNAKDLMFDSVHPNDRGYQKIANNLVQQISSYKL